MSVLMSSREVADRLRIRIEAVTRWCVRGEVPGAFRTPGGQWRIPSDALPGLPDHPQTSGPGALPPPTAPGPDPVQQEGRAPSDGTRPGS